MRSIQAAFLCAGIRFRRRLSVPRTYLILVVVAIFCFYHFHPVCELARYYHQSCPPWLFPFYMSTPAMLTVHGGLCLLLYSDAGEVDGFAYLMLSRSGRKAYICGQLLEILGTSFLYALLPLVFSILHLLPVLGWDADWGLFIRTLAESSGTMEAQAGLSLSIVVFPEIFAVFTPSQATAAAFLCLWLSTAFIGVLISFCRVYFEKSVGIIAAGICVSIAVFSVYSGMLILGLWLQYLSPLSWSSILYLNWFGVEYHPSPAYAYGFYTVGILAMCIAAFIGYGRRDIQ